MRESALRGVVRDVWPLMPALAFLVLFFAVPLALILPESLHGAHGVSVDAYQRVLAEPYYWKVIGRSFWLSLLSTAACLVIGYPVAYYLVRLVDVRWKRFAYMVVIAPLFTSAVIRAMAWIVILGKKGILNQALQTAGVVDDPIRFLYTESAIVIGLVYIMIPFMVLTIAAVLENVEGVLEEAARDLGATPVETFTRVTFPLTIPGVIAGCFLVFALCLSSYVTPALLGGGRTKVMAMLIFEQFLRVFNWQLGAALSCVLLMVTVLLMWGYNRVLARRLVGGRSGIEATL